MANFLILNQKKKRERVSDGTFDPFAPYSRCEEDFSFYSRVLRIEASPPSRGRGSKLLPVMACALIIVAPFAGAWIDTSVRHLPPLAQASIQH